MRKFLSVVSILSAIAKRGRVPTLIVLSLMTTQHRLIAQVDSAAWNSAGQDLANTRSQFQESGIGPTNVGGLKTAWTFTTGGNVSATPTVSGNSVYFPDLKGNLYAVNKQDGALLWSHSMSDYTGVTGTVTRVSPAIDGAHIFIGDKLGSSTVRVGADVLSINSATGALDWITQVESHPAAIITGSPIVYDGIVYIGVSSNEEGFAEQASYACCTFRGSVVALDETTGKVLWKTYTVPDNGGEPGGYSGAAIWSPPAIDTVRQAIYVGTANNYTAPASVDACENASPTKNCAASGDYFDSVLSLNLKTGAINWGTHLLPYDIWTLACIRPSAPQANCPVPSSPDSGSGSGPNLMGNIVGVGQKDGTYWALNADTGAPIWETQVGPGGSAGGIQWGTATDGSRIYLADANSDGASYTLEPSGKVITWGAWSALDISTGKILWQTADPTSGAQDLGSVSVANGVMYAGSNSGYMYALNAQTGSVLWNFNSGGSVIDGPSIVDGELFWGSGYNAITNDKVFAFAPAVGTATQSITFGALANQTYGKAPFTLAAGASSGLPVTYTAMGPAKVSGSTLTITGTGTVEVIATQSGSTTYAEAAPVTQSFTVGKSALKVIANNASRSFSSPNPAFGYTLTGLVNGGHRGSSGRIGIRNHDRNHYIRARNIPNHFLDGVADGC